VVVEGEWSGGGERCGCDHGVILIYLTYSYDSYRSSQFCGEQMLHRLRHPFIVALLGVYVHDERILIVTEFCPYNLPAVVQGKRYRKPDDFVRVRGS
jgi:serine/threonine protein kinase